MAYQKPAWDCRPAATEHIGATTMCRCSHFLVEGGRLALLIEGHHHDRCAVSLHDLGVVPTQTQKARQEGSRSTS